MMAMGGMELIMILGLLAGGGGSLDIVSALPAKEYFKARDIEVSADKLMELAVQEPDSAKKQFGQLMALSHLANDVELLKKSAKLAAQRKTLGDIAQGKKASDPNGFAASYAQKVLFVLDEQKPPATPKRSWKEGLKALPENASIVGFVDLATGQSAERKFPELNAIFDVLPQNDKETFWSAVEKIGNLQIDSLGFALAQNAAGDKIGEMVIRFTGKGNPDWLAAALNDLKEDTSKQRVGPAGEKVRILTAERDGPAIAIIGSTEVLIGGYPPEFNRGAGKKNHADVIDRLLAQRGKKSDGALQGVLKADFAKIPADANGLLVGNLPKEMREAPIPMPTKVLAHAKRIIGGIDVQASGAMADESGAKGLIDVIGKGRDQGLQELKKVQGQPLPIPGLNIGSIISILESIQLQANGSEVQLRLLMPDDAMMMLPMGILMPIRAVRMAAPPAPVPVPVPVEKK
jgi:hypothetical protein